jgi:hypothetical protein
VANPNRTNRRRRKVIFEAHLLEAKVHPAEAIEGDRRAQEAKEEEAEAGHESEIN